MKKNTDLGLTEQNPQGMIEQLKRSEKPRITSEIIDKD
jgi:hypothetical protein